MRMDFSSRMNLGSLHKRQNISGTRLQVYSPAVLCGLAHSRYTPLATRNVSCLHPNNFDVCTFPHESIIICQNPMGARGILQFPARFFLAGRARPHTLHSRIVHVHLVFDNISMLLKVLNVHPNPKKNRPSVVKFRVIYSTRA